MNLTALTLVKIGKNVSFILLQRKCLFPEEFIFRLRHNVDITCLNRLKIILISCGKYLQQCNLFERFTFLYSILETQSMISSIHCIDGRHVLPN